MTVDALRGIPDMPVRPSAFPTVRAVAPLAVLTGGQGRSALTRQETTMYVVLLNGRYVGPFASILEAEAWISGQLAAVNTSWHIHPVFMPDSD